MAAPKKSGTEETEAERRTRTAATLVDIVNKISANLRQLAKQGSEPDTSKEKAISFLRKRLDETEAALKAGTGKAQDFSL
jgi:hypothetical protein